MSETAYAHINARIKHLETRLPDRIDLERMVGAATAADAFQVLYDTDYANNMQDLKPEQYYQALKADLQELKTFLQTYVPNKTLVQLLLLQDDYNNLKARLKQKHQVNNISPDDFSNFGSVPSADWADPVNAPRDWWAVITEAKADLGENPAPQAIDAYVDSKYFAAALILAKKIKSQFVHDYIKMQIDHANLKIFIRARFIGLDKNTVSQHWILGGSFTASNLDSAYADEGLSVTSLFKSKFNDAQWKRINEVLETKNAGELTGVLDQIEYSFLDSVVYQVFGPAPVVAYVRKKLDAIRNVRVIMIGKINNLSQDVIQSRVYGI